MIDHQTTDPMEEWGIEDLEKAIDMETQPETTPTEFYTVVYRVVGGKARHDEWWQSVHSLFLGDGPISITTIAAGDALTRLDEALTRWTNWKHTE